MTARIHLSAPPLTLTPCSPHWPARLSELAQPPLQLQVAGDPTALAARVGSVPPVAIVGTRFAHEDGWRFARELARQLAAAGATIVSGGASGIDTAAHLGALDAGGCTVAVLATGLSTAYPRDNAGLFAKIAQMGALVCEHTTRTGGNGWQFLRRNRLIAALGSVVVVVQAPHRSGALSTARAAKKLKRPVFAVPSAPWDPRGTGCLELLRDGARICASAADILSLATPGLGEASGPPRRTLKDTNDLNNLGHAAQAVFQLLCAGPCHPDRIATQLDMKAAEVQGALLTLMMSGMCKQRADGSYVASSS